MKKNIIIVTLLLLVFTCISCTKESVSLFDDFMQNKIPAYKEDGSKLWKNDLEFDDNDWNCYRVGKKLDIDNDGENEQLIEGPKGGFYLDRRNEQLYVMPDIGECMGDMSYYKQNDEYLIVYKDALSSYHEYFRVLKYQGKKVVEDTELKKSKSSDGDFEYYINSEAVSEENYNIEKNKIEEID